MKSDRAVDAYIAAQPPAVRRALTRVRRTIRKAVPDAVETISYKIPTYKLHGRTVLHFAGWKAHYALYPGNGRLTTELKDELAKYEVSKGTIRFPLADPVPVELIERIAIYRAQQVSGPA